MASACRVSARSRSESWSEVLKARGLELPGAASAALNWLQVFDSEAMAAAAGVEGSSGSTSVCLSSGLGAGQDDLLRSEGAAECKARLGLALTPARVARYRPRRASRTGGAMLRPPYSSAPPVSFPPG